MDSKDNIYESAPSSLEVEQPSTSRAAITERVSAVGDLLLSIAAAPEMIRRGKVVQASNKALGADHAAQLDMEL